nr:MAG TPA: hypothetical protein [Caudoviricetes sp.]
MELTVVYLIIVLSITVILKKENSLNYVIKMKHMV